MGKTEQELVWSPKEFWVHPQALIAAVTKHDRIGSEDVSLLPVPGWARYVLLEGELNPAERHYWPTGKVCTDPWHSNKEGSCPRCGEPEKAD